MSLFYVYMRWHKPSNMPSASGSCARQLLTCESRYVADEFFRALQTLQTGSGKPIFTLLKRDTPQFWLYDTTDSDPSNALVDILCTSPLPLSVQGRVMSTLLHDGQGPEWPIAPVVQGRDWVHGRTYFIRNIRQPNIYWFYSRTQDGEILASESQRTKFRVCGTEFRNDEKKVLIRSDYIWISIAQNDVGSPEVHARPQNNRLVCTADSPNWRFKFQDLLGRFGTAWELRAGGWVGYVTWSEDGEQDEWELC